MIKWYWILAGVLLMTGCSTIQPWSRSKVLQYPYDQVWDACYKIVAKRYDLIRTNEDEGECESDWDLHLSPFYKEGYRTKLYLKIVSFDPEDQSEDDIGPKPAPEEDPKNYVVKIKIIKEINTSMDNPTSPDSAEWEECGTFIPQERHLLILIENRLDPYGMGGR